MDPVLNENFTQSQAAAYADLAKRVIASDNQMWLEAGNENQEVYHNHPGELVNELVDQYNSAMKDFGGMIGNESISDVLGAMSKKATDIGNKIKSYLTGETALDKLEKKFIDLESSLPKTGVPRNKTVSVSRLTWAHLTNANTTKLYLTNVPYMTDLITHNKFLSTAEFLIDLCLNKIFPSVRSLGHNPPPDKYDQLYDDIIEKGTYNQRAIESLYLSKCVPMDKHVQLTEKLALYGYIPKRATLGGFSIYSYFGYEKEEKILDYFKTKISGSPVYGQAVYTGDMDALTLSQIKTMVHDARKLIDAVRVDEKEFAKLTKKLNTFFDEFFKLSKGCLFYTNKRPLVYWLNVSLVGNIMSSNQLTGPRLALINNTVSVIDSLYNYAHTSAENLK